MPEDPHAYLEEFGLSAPEVEAYIALLRNGPLGASAIASVTRLRRSNVYHALDSLAEKGLVEGASGYGSRFTAVPAKQALPALISREKEALSERERLAGKIVEQLASFEEPVESPPGELIQIFRSPQLVTERFRRLQLESERQVDVINKRPFLSPKQGNPAQQKAQRRGVRYRALYEREALEDPAIKPFIAGWIAAGEESRICHVEPPHKMAIFDEEAVLMPLAMPGDQMRILFIKHPQLARSLSMLFEYLWKDAEPITPDTLKQDARARQSRRSPAKTSDSHPSGSRDGRPNHNAPVA